MSRIGKKPILIPAGVEAKIEGRKVTIKGPKGELVKEFEPAVKIENKEGNIVVTVSDDTKRTRALWGLTRALISNMVKGVVTEFTKQLEIQGVGFKMAVEGNNVVLNVGYSHSIKMEIPKGIKASVEKSIMTLSGCDKELVGQFASNIRKVKRVEPYKGKGIRYVGEFVKRKEGKKAVATTTG